MDRIAYRINDFSKAIGICRSSVYSLIKDGKLKAIRIAGRTLIPATEADRLLSQGLPEGGANVSR